MGRLFEELFGRWLSDQIGFFNLFAGLFVAFGLWCFDYIPSEIYIGRWSSVVLLVAIGLSSIAAGLFLADSTAVAAVSGLLIGGFYFVSFRRLKANQLRAQITPENQK